MGGTSVVNVTRGDTTVQVAVTPGTVQGEWTKVQASDLQSGDQVYATLVSTVESDEEDQVGPGAAGMLGGATGGGGGPPGN